MSDFNLVACADEMVVAIRKLLNAKTRETFDEAKEHVDGAVNQYHQWRDGRFPVSGRQKSYDVKPVGEPRKKHDRPITRRIPTCHPEAKHFSRGLCQVCYQQMFPQKGKLTWRNHIVDAKAMTKANLEKMRQCK